MALKQRSYIVIISENIKMTAVALGDIYSHKIAYRVQKIRDDRKAVLIEGFNALILEWYVFVVGRTNKCPVSSALVKEYAEEFVYIRILESCIKEKYMVLDGFVDLTHHSCFAVK